MVFKSGISGVVITALLLTFAGKSAAQHARIKIDIDRTIGQVDSNIYGNFVEHLGRCVYGGIYDKGSPLSDKDGYRKDVMKAVKECKNKYKL